MRSFNLLQQFRRGALTTYRPYDDVPSLLSVSNSVFICLLSLELPNIESTILVILNLILGRDSKASGSSDAIFRRKTFIKRAAYSKNP